MLNMLRIQTKGLHRQIFRTLLLAKQTRASTEVLGPNRPINVTKAVQSYLQAPVSVTKMLSQHNWGALQIQDRSPQLRPVVSECICDWLRDATVLIVATGLGFATHPWLRSS